jgi:hypothetical protein
MKTKFNTTSALLLLVLITGCSSYTIQTTNLVDQLKAKQHIAPNAYFQQFSLVDYPSNNLDKIKCEDKNGNKVWLYPDKNTQFVFTKKSTGEKVKAYFDTVIFQRDTLFGLRSRLVGGLRAIPISDVNKIVISAEMPKTEPVAE